MYFARRFFGSLTLVVVGVSIALPLAAVQPSAFAAKPKPESSALPAGKKAEKSKENSPVQAQTRKELEALSAAMHQEARAIGNDMRDDEEVSAADIAMLFQAAVERNDTIRFAINTLSRRDENGQPVQDDGALKRMAGSLTRLAGTAGSMLTGNPAGVLGADAVNQLLASGSTGDPYQHRVTDADMVILAREIDKLQWGVIEKYYSYRYAKERLTLAEEARRTQEKYMDKAFAENPADAKGPMGTIMETLVESARQDESQARQEFTSARNSLLLLVGPDAVTVLENPHPTQAES